MIVAITGGTGSGKSYISSIMEELGSFIIDADEIAHEIILKGYDAYEEIIDIFGVGILDEFGEINRKELGKIVFNDKEKLKLLNECTHKHIERIIIEQAQRVQNEDEEGTIVIDVPILDENSPIYKICERIIVISAPLGDRINRIVKRDNISDEDALARINSQKKFEEYRSMSHYIIDNNSDIDEEELFFRVREVYVSI